MERTITEFAMTKARFAEMGLGTGLADVRDVELDLDVAKGPHRLMGSDQHPTDDALLLTRWISSASYPGFGRVSGGGHTSPFIPIVSKNRHNRPTWAASRSPRASMAMS